MNKKLLFLGFFTLILVNSIFALGISPSIHRADFEPNLELQYEFRVMANQDQEIEIYAAGDLKEYVKFSKTNFVGKNSFVANINLPEKLDRPGKHVLLIGVREIAQSASGVGVSVVVQAPIVIRVPYPGEYAELAFDMRNTNVDEKITYDLTVYSRGDQSIDTNPIIEIYDLSDNKVEELNLGSKKILNQDSFNFVGNLVNEYGAGDYRAVSIVDYVAGIAKAEKGFRVGHLFVDVNEFSNEALKLGIQPFSIEIESFWNDPIENIFAEVYISKDSEAVIDFLTPSITLNSWQKNSIVGYMDTSNLDYGTYDVRIVLNYGEKTEIEGKMKIVREKDNRFIYYIIGVFVLLIVLYFWRKRKNPVVKLVKKNGKK